MTQHLQPLIKTELPGPIGKQIISKDQAHASPSYIKEYALVVDRGEGCWVYDVDGNRFLDMMAGIAVNSTGYVHPQVTAAVKQAVEKIWHICATDFYSRPFSDLLEKLAGLVPAMGKKRVFVTNSGTEAVEGALKLARFHTKRPLVLAFQGAFHGRTLGAISVSASKVHHRAHFGPLLPGVLHAPFPDPQKRPEGLSPEAYGEKCLSYLEKEVFKRHSDPKEFAAIIIEPIQGEGGYICPPSGFLQGLRRLCDQHGILLIFDEIQSGVGRTGKMFAADHFEVYPDILLTAKGLGSGMPIGAILAKDSVMTWPRGSHGSTFGGNSVCCAAALATLEVVESLLPQVVGVGGFLKKGLQELARKYPTIVDVRGPGLMLGFEFADPVTKEPAGKLVADLVQAAFKNGLLLLSCGVSTIRLTPPLVCTMHEAKVCLEILDRTLRDLGDGR